MYSLLWVIVIGTSIWVGFDSHTLLSQIPKDKRKVLSSGATSPFVWVLGCFLLWIIAFPWYLSARSKYINYLKGTSSQSIPVSVTVRYCSHCGVKYQGEQNFCHKCGAKLS